MTLFIDADACPVKGEAETVATRHKVRMVVVSNGGIRPSQNPLVESVFVASGPDEADKWIAAAAGPARDGFALRRPLRFNAKKPAQWLAFFRRT